MHLRRRRRTPVAARARTRPIEGKGRVRCVYPEGGLTRYVCMYVYIYIGGRLLLQELVLVL